MKRCLSCGYDLWTATRRRCPECARPFDPDDPRTFIWARSPDALAIVLIVLSGFLAILFALQRIKFTTPYDDVALILRMMMAVVFVAWLVCARLLWKSLRRYRVEVRGFRDG